MAVKPVSRSSGRSATGSSAYRAAEKIVDERTGEIHDYTRKRGVESADIVLPDGSPEWAEDRSKLWNAAELAEKRKDACVAREYEVALPTELSQSERRRLAVDFAKDMANREGCAVDVCIHLPGKGGDDRNHHAHILRTTRKVDAEGLGEKLDTEKAGRNRAADLEAVRARWAEMLNERLRENGIDASVDHRSLEAQGIDREPTKHLGPAATGYERRTGEESRRRADFAAVRDLERLSRDLWRTVCDLSAELVSAKKERDKSAGEPLQAAYMLAEARGQYSGKVIEVTATHVIQAAGREKPVAHEIHKLDRVPKVGDNVTVKYYSTPAKVEDRTPDRGWGLGR